MALEEFKFTLIDGPTLLIEVGGLRLLTDPTFDEPQSYAIGRETLRKLNSPPLSPEALLPIHAVLLSHDQHIDNLDYAGRAFLPKVDLVLSTEGTAERLSGWAVRPEDFGPGAAPVSRCRMVVS